MPLPTLKSANAATGPLALLRFRRLWLLTPVSQVVVITVLYVLTTLLFAKQFRQTGSMDGYPPDVWILFVPITEEILFRGFILGALEQAYGPIRALVGSSALFGLWHLKNTFWMTPSDLETQMLYTGFVFGPVMALITLRLRTLWLCVILHYLNNLPPGLWLLLTGQ